MKRGGFAIPVAAGLALLLAIWVTSTDAIELMSGGHSRAGRLPPGVREVRIRERRRHGTLEQPGLDPGENHIFSVMEWVVLGICTAALLGFLALVIVKGRERKRARLAAARAIDEDAAVDAMLLPAQVVEAARRQLHLLSEGSPRNAIVACWMELELACSDSGFPRHPAETSSEFTARVLGHFVVDPSTVDHLAALYREARFSEHELSEPHRSTAISDLEHVLDSLEQTHRRQHERSGLVGTT